MKFFASAIFVQPITAKRTNENRLNENYRVSFALARCALYRSRTLARPRENHFEPNFAGNRPQKSSEKLIYKHIALIDRIFVFFGTKQLFSKLIEKWKVIQREFLNKRKRKKSSEFTILTSDF